MKRFFRTVFGRSEILKELMVFLWENRLWWIIPFIIVLIVFGVLVIFAQASPVSPFIYALF